MNIQMTDKSPNSTTHLNCEKRASSDTAGIQCFTLIHNEAHILPQFLEHYRGLGIKHFIMVDDHSTDKTWEILCGQDDVTAYKPKPGSSYNNDKIAWRCDLLDEMADQKWVLLPDADEHLIYPKMDKYNIQQFAKQLETEGAQALFTVMVDMYGDKPLKDHHFSGGNLIETFPFFDNPSDPVFGYRLMPPAKRFLKQFPTPPVCAYGGVRDRIFFSESHSISPIAAWMLRKFSNFDRPLTPNFFQRAANSITRKLTKKRFGPNPFTMTKIGMVKWERGMKLPGGPHAVSRKLKLATTTGAVLHFKFTKGLGGVEYIVKRGQHAGGSIIYQKILDKADLFELSPFCEISRRFTGPGSFIDCGLIRLGSQQIL